MELSRFAKDPHAGWHPAMQATGPYFTEQTTKGGSDDSKNRPC